MKPLNPLFLLIDQLLLDDPEHYYTYQEILEAKDGKKFEHTARRTDTVKGHKDYQALQDAIKSIKKQLKMQGLSLEFKNGKDASEGFRFPRGIEDPMAAKKTNNQQMRSAQLKRLIEASVGLFPSSWLADLLAGAQCLGEGKKVILFDQNMQLENLKWVPTIFDAIEKGRVVQFAYNPKYGDVKEILLFHPYYLKEYNQRWFVFGKATDLTGKPLAYSNCAIDRIIGEVELRDDVEFIPSKSKDFASSYFKDIVGVTRKKNRHPVKILIATNDVQTHGRIMTKPIHARTQSELEPFSATLGRRGLISIEVIPNDELDTLLLSYGAGIEILGDYRETFIQKVEALKNLYFQQGNNNVLE